MANNIEIYISFIYNCAYFNLEDGYVEKVIRCGISLNIDISFL